MRSGPPSEREFELTAEVMRTARLMEHDLQSRMDCDPYEIKDLVQRYAPLKFLLNDSIVRELCVAGRTREARYLRERNRERYSRLVRCLSRDKEVLKKISLRICEDRGRWEGYNLVDSWFLDLVIMRLRAAFILHKFHAPGVTALTRVATYHLCRSLVPIAPVIPIRPC